jgi:hypothetical protein
MKRARRRMRPFEPALTEFFIRGKLSAIAMAKEGE